MWVRGVHTIVLLGIALPSLALAQSGVFRTSFSETTEGRPTGLAVDDFDNDGTLDVVVTAPDTRDGSVVEVLNGTGDGTFFLDFNRIVVNGFPSALLLAPFDDDAIPDLIVADGNGGSVTFLKGLHNSDYFASPGPPIPVGSLPEGLAADHLNGDNVLDLVVANRGSSDTTPGSVSILRGQGDGTFVTVLQLDPTPEEPNRLVPALATELNTTAVVIGDLDDDDVVDIVALNTGSNSLTVFFGSGDLTFGDRTTIPIGPGPEDIPRRLGR
jgi:hypothetical protein